VSEIKTRVGIEPVEALMTVTDSSVSLDGSLTLDEARLVKPGMEVRIDEPTLGITARGRVTEVADRPGTKGVDGFHVYMAASIENPPPTLVGSSVRLTIPVSSTQGEVLAVPVSAVYLEPDGTSSVRRSVDGTTVVVRVQPGVSSDGYVAVTAPEGGLSSGDLVVVGTGR
jgi:multidrug efflux pump subunit AcrA (membrane-fusion protein)